MLPVIFLIIGYAAMQNKEVKDLMPSLRSNWLGFHVSTVIIAYGSFGVSFVLALIFLTLAFYRFSSFAYECGDTGRFAAYSGIAVVLSLASLADGGPHLSSLLLYAGGAVFLLGFLLRMPEGSENVE